VVSTRLPVRLAACLAGLALACGEGGLEPGAVARIGERHLDYAEFSAYVEEVTGEPGDALESSVLAGLFRQFLEEELLVELARGQDLVAPHAGRRHAAAALLGPGQLEVSDEDVRRYYIERAAELEAPERLRLRHLLFEERAAAERAAARLRAGEPAAGVAAELGALGLEELEASRDDLPRAFAEPLFALDPGAVAVYGDGFQFHVFVALARRPAGLPAFEELAPELRRRVTADRARARRAELLEEARRRYDVQIAEARLPFALPAADDPAAAPRSPEEDPP
jgi:hypothetical protein